MEFEWDPVKRALNVEKHGIAFEDVPALFARFHERLPSPREDEMRWIAIGELEGRILTVVFTQRGQRIRLISARRARRTEAALYTSRLSR